jgi:hypothetical protein
VGIIQSAELCSTLFTFGAISACMALFIDQCERSVLAIPVSILLWSPMQKKSGLPKAQMDKEKKMQKQCGSIPH